VEALQLLQLRAQLGAVVLLLQQRPLQALPLLPLGAQLALQTQPEDGGDGSTLIPHTRCSPQRGALHSA